MVQFLHKFFRLWQKMLWLAACLCVFSFSGVAQTPSPLATQPNFTRVMLSSKEASGLQIQASGSTLTLKFDTADGLTTALLKDRLKDTALGVQQGTNRNEFIINLKKPYRVRQFVSGDGIGFDILESATPASPPPPSNSLSATSANTALPEPLGEKNLSATPSKASDALPANIPFQPATDLSSKRNSLSPPKTSSASTNNTINPASVTDKNAAKPQAHASNAPKATPAANPQSQPFPQKTVSPRVERSVTSPSIDARKNSADKTIVPSAAKTPPLAASTQKNVATTKENKVSNPVTKNTNSLAPENSHTIATTKSNPSASSASALVKKQPADTATSEVISTKESPLSAPVIAISPPISEIVTTKKPEKSDVKTAEDSALPSQTTSVKTVAAGRDATSDSAPATSSSDAPRTQSDAAVEQTPTEATEAATTQNKAPLIVGIEPTKEGSALVFPFQTRTAATIFKRQRDWWIIFSTPSHIDLPQLRTILPTTITSIEHFDAPQHTILRLGTDGSLSLNGTQPKGSYAWRIALDPASISPQSYKLRTAADAKSPYIEIAAFDISSPLPIKDPKLGDTLLIIPSFESNKAVTSAYQNPDLSFIPAQQGIVLSVRNEALTTSYGRTGIRISAPLGLALARDLPHNNESAELAEDTDNILLPYNRWKVSARNFHKVQTERTLAFSNATPENKPKAILDLVRLYMAQGFMEEALSLLTHLRDRFPAYYRENQLAALRAVANFMLFRMPEAAADITSEELQPSEQIELWKEAISLFIPEVLAPKPLAAPTTQAPASATDKPASAENIVLATPAPHFDYLKYNADYISRYPPKIRQKLAIVATDNYITNKAYSKAARTLDTLNRDGSLEPIQKYAEYLLGKIAADTGKHDQAINLWKPLAAQQEDPLIRARAEFSLVTLEYANGKRSLKSTINHLERLRAAWRGDTLEQNLLSYLGQLYLDNKDYGNALRTWRDLVRYYPNAANSFDITKKMATLFEQLFSEGLADDMQPLRSLGLFYEFRELTPVGARGDLMIQKLADRLAQVDLLDKAAALLEHQVKFRLQGEERSKVGAQLAIVNLLNKQPEKALEALEISGYGGASDALAAERNRITALALSQTKKPELALELLSADRTPKGQELRLEILWEMQDWPNVISVAEDALSNRLDLGAPLSMKETENLLKLALAYSFEKNLTQLKYLREYYTPLLSDSPYKAIFDYLTNDTAPIDPEDFAMVAKQISTTEDFLKSFKDSIANGRLSTAVNEKNAEPSSSENDKANVSEKNSQLIPESAQPATIDEAVDTEASTTEQQPESVSAPVQVEGNNSQTPANIENAPAESTSDLSANSDLPQILGADSAPQLAPPAASTIAPSNPNSGQNQTVNP